MDEPPRNYLDDFEDDNFDDQQAEIMVEDSDDELPDQQEIIVDDSDDEDNLPVLPNREQEIMVEDADDNGEDNVNDVVFEDPGAEIVVEGSDDDFDDEIPVDFNDNDQDGEFINIFQETFSLNVDAQGLNAPLLAQGNLQVAENFILILARSLRFKESYASMLASFKIANLGFNNANHPIYMRQFWRIVNRRNDDFSNIVVCTICWEELGHGKRPVRNCRCGACGPQQTNSELGTFLYINLRSQLQALLAKPGMARDLQYPYTRIKRHENAIEDVYDGSEYQRLTQEGAFLSRGNNNYSLALWTDGVSPVSTSNVGIWPVFIQVLELSARARQRNSLLAAVYVGPRKPHMSVFLMPVARELRDLRLNGVTWRPNNRNEEIISRFMTLIVSADSEARYLVFGMVRHNGYNGCTFCHANGERIAQQHPLIYRYNDGHAPDRTDAEIREDARLAVDNNEPQRGVRTVSAMSIIPDFDLRVGQLVEAMHCLWEGNFVRLFQNLKDPNNENNITPGQLATISNRIMQIKTPTKLSRFPRDLTRFANFTATEYRNLALFYWLPCAQDFMNENQLTLCALFAEATFILNKDSILPHELDRAAELMDQYRQRFEQQFPENQLVYNVHLLKHIVRCIRELGPAWVASGFWFESLNRKIINYMTSPTARASQIACRMLLGQMVEKFMDRQLNPRVENLLREFNGKERWDEAPEVATGRFARNDGNTIPGTLTPQEIAALAENGIVDVDEQLPIIRHWRMNIDGVRYQLLRDRVVKYNNSIAHVNLQYQGEEVSFINIQSIITWHGGNRQGMFGNAFRTIGPAFNTTYMKIVEETNNLVYISLRDVIASAVLVRSNEQIYISRLPNCWDND